jgi:peptide/nickel transport system ATP-binding protein
MVDAILRATILKNIHDLKDKHGISILYITHDLATAYHVSDYVMVLYQWPRGGGRATGKEVIGDPQHPYTRLLIDSIPWPDVDRDWGSAEQGQAGLDALSAEAEAQPVFRGTVPGFDLTVGA